MSSTDICVGAVVVSIAW